jgi:hypothetical protein
MGGRENVSPRSARAQRKYQFACLIGTLMCVAMGITEFRIFNVAVKESRCTVRKREIKIGGVGSRRCMIRGVTMSDVNYFFAPSLDEEQGKWEGRRQSSLKKG